MKVLALDLGFLNTGFSVIENNNIKQAGVITFNHKKFTIYVSPDKSETFDVSTTFKYQNEKIQNYLHSLNRIVDEYSEIFSQEIYDNIVAETTFFGAQSYKAGVYMAISATFWILKYPKLVIVQPQLVKKHIKQKLETTKVSKTDVIKWINDIYQLPDISNIPKSLHNHIYDSIAAYYIYHKEG